MYSPSAFCARSDEPLFLYRLRMGWLSSLFLRRKKREKDDKKFPRKAFSTEEKPVGGANPVSGAQRVVVLLDGDGD